MGSLEPCTDTMPACSQPACHAMVPNWVAEGCGFIGVAGFILMLMPQIVLNARKRSTEGLSLGLVLLWHSSAILACAFYFGQLDTFISILCFGLSCAVLEGQIVAFRPASSARTPWQRFAILSAVTAVSSALSAGLVAAVTFLMGVLPKYADFGVGDYLPSLLL